MDDVHTFAQTPPSPSGPPPSVGRDPAVGEGSTSHSARPPALNVDELQARCVHIYGLLRAGLITPSECHQAITVLEHHYGVR